MCGVYGVTEIVTPHDFLSTFVDPLHALPSNTCYKGRNGKLGDRSGQGTIEANEGCSNFYMDNSGRTNLRFSPSPPRFSSLIPLQLQIFYKK